MHLLVDSYRTAGVFAHLQVVVFLGGALWAFACAVFLGLRWRVPPLLATAPLFLVPLVVAVGATFGYAEATDAAGQSDPAARATLMAAGLSGGMSQGWFGLLAVPVAGLFGVGGLAAGIRGPREWGAPALVFAVALLTALLPIAGLFADVPLPLVAARVLLYGLGVVPLALATANAHRAGNGPEGGMVAAAAWVAVVGAGELATLTYGWVQGFQALAYVDPASRAALVETMSSEMGDQGTLAWIVFTLSAVPALICALRSGPEATEAEILAGDASPSPMRSLGRILAFGVWPLWAFAIAATSPAAVLVTMGSLPHKG